MSDDFTEIIRIPEFEKDFKKLIKRFGTLDEETSVIEFIEIYYKGDKKNEDKERIYKNFKK